MYVQKPISHITAVITYNSVQQQQLILCGSATNVTTFCTIITTCSDNSTESCLH